MDKNLYPFVEPVFVSSADVFLEWLPYNNNDSINFLEAISKFTGSMLNSAHGKQT